MEWKEVKLGDFIEFNPKRTIKKGEEARKITMDLLIPHSKQIYNWTYEPYSGGAKFKNGDTIMARITPCLENGKHAYISLLDKDEIAYGSTEYIVMCGKEGVSDNDFIYYLSHTPLFKDTAVKSMVGSSGRQRAQVDVLQAMNMFVPKHIEDQRRIASILSSLDSKIETNNKINAKLEEMAQALFKSWFVDFEPFKDKGMVESELGMIPEGWRVGKLGDIAEINPKLTLKKGQEATYLDMSAMPTSGSFPKEWTRKEYAGGMKFQNHDTLMARITPCLENGKVAYVDFLSEQEVGFGSTEYIVMRPKNGKLPEFFYFLCRHREFVDYATKNMNGSSGRQRVSGETIGNNSLVLPPESVIESLECVFKGIMD